MLPGTNLGVTLTQRSPILTGVTLTILLLHTAITVIFFFLHLLYSLTWNFQFFKALECTFLKSHDTVQIPTCIFSVPLFNSFMKLTDIKVEGGLVVQVCVNVTPPGKFRKLLTSRGVISSN